MVGRINACELRIQFRLAFLAKKSLKDVGQELPNCNRKLLTHVNILQLYSLYLSTQWADIKFVPFF